MDRIVLSVIDQWRVVTCLNRYLVLVLRQLGTTKEQTYYKKKKKYSLTEPSSVLKLLFRKKTLIFNTI